MAIIYLLQSFIFGIKEFFRRWYINSFFIWSNFVVLFLERLDRFFAFRITLRFLFKPLYQDYSVVGHILGFIFRLIRLFIGGLVYFIVIVIAAALYLIWWLIPFYLALKILNLY